MVLWFLAGALAGAAAVVAVLSLLLFSSRAGEALDAETCGRLEALAREAIQTHDVPCGAVVLYEGKVIGSGTNTVYEHGDGGGHADIVAISDAIRKLGPRAFNELDRDKLVLITSWEPCPMCRGAALVHRIHHVHFATKKPLSEVVRDRVHEIRHFLRRRRRPPFELQERFMAAYFAEHGPPGPPPDAVGSDAPSRRPR